MNADDIVIRRAGPDDCLAIAELAQLASEGIMGYFWKASRRPGETLAQAGARHAASKLDSFTYRNAWIACKDARVAAMLLGFRLPAAADNPERADDFPPYIQPMVELEQIVAESFFVDMLATYPQFRGLGVGSGLMARVDDFARAAGASLISLLVFGHNSGALRFYRRLGFEPVESRPIAASPTTPAGEILLLTRPTRPA